MSASKPVVVSANVAAKSKSWQRKTWNARLDHIGSGVDYFTPDLVAIQESGDTPYLLKLDAVMREVDLLRAAGGGRWRHIYYRPETFRRRESGLFRLNTLNTRHAAWGRFQARTPASWGAQPELMFTSSHLSVGWTSFTDRARLAEAGRLIRLTDAKNVHKLPIVHAGDFNSYNMVTDKAMRPAGFRDSRTKAELWVHRSGYNTYNGRNTVKVPTGPMPMHAHHDDHIYVEGIDTLTWTQRADYDPSDHNFIAARLEWRK